MGQPLLAGVRVVDLTGEPGQLAGRLSDDELADLVERDVVG